VSITAKNSRALVGLLCLGLTISACGHSARDGAARFSEDEKHRLYAAALAASETPAESEILKRVCRQIEIFDASGKPNDRYLQFVGAHVDWATKTQSEQFRNEINTREKARQYIDRQLAGNS